MRTNNLSLRMSGCHFYTQQAGLLCRPKHIGLRFRMFHQSLSNAHDRSNFPRGIRGKVPKSRIRSVERFLEIKTQITDPNILRQIAREREASKKGGTSDEDNTTVPWSSDMPSSQSDLHEPETETRNTTSSTFDQILRSRRYEEKLGFQPWDELIPGASLLDEEYRWAEFRKSLNEYESWDNPAPKYPLYSTTRYDSGRAIDLFQRSWVLQQDLPLETDGFSRYPNLRFPHHPLPIPSSVQEGEDYQSTLHGNPPPQWHFIFCLARLDPRNALSSRHVRKMEGSWGRVQNIARRDYFMLHYIDRVRSQQKKGALFILDPLETLTAGLCLPWNLNISLLRGGYDAWRYHHKTWLRKQKRKDLDEETVKWLLREDEKDVIVETKVKEPRTYELSKPKRKEFRTIFTAWKHGNEYSKGGLNLNTLFGKRRVSLSEEDAVKRYCTPEFPGKSLRQSADRRQLEKDKLLLADLDLGTTVKTARPVYDEEMTKMILKKAVDLDMAISDDEVVSRQDWQLPNGHVKEVFKCVRLKKFKDCNSTVRWRRLVSQWREDLYDL